LLHGAKIAGASNAFAARLIEEPLALSAPLAHRLAAELCRIDPATGESCAWYHGFWQYVRLLGLGTSPVGHAAFYARAFAGLASPKPRVLICGAADYAMLAYAGDACRQLGLQAEFTMIDWCQTPLTLARWYAERESLPLRTVRQDLIEPMEASETRQDAICTHALLGHFRPDSRARLISNWHGALRSGGRVCTVNRLRPGQGNAPAAFSSGQVEAFVETVRQRAASRADLGASDLARLASEAARYAARQVSWPVHSADEVQALFEDAGFRIEHMSCGPMAEAGQPALNVPTVAGNADYVRIVAVK
jgi:SAM-dependent methyltransferase